MGRKSISDGGVKASWSGVEVESKWGNEWWLKWKVDIIIIVAKGTTICVMEAAMWFVWLGGREWKTSRETTILQLHLQNAADKSGVGVNKCRREIAQNRAGSHRFCWQVGAKVVCCELWKGVEWNNGCSEWWECSGEAITTGRW